MITLCLIVKNCAKDLERALNSAAKYVDEICITDTGSTDDTVEVAKKYGAKVSYFEWNGKYEDARNFNFSQATGDWIIWMDSDDTIRGLDKMKDFLSNLDPMIGVVAARYEYAKDKYGNVSVIQWRNRIVRNGWCKWGSEGGLHEDLLLVKNTLVVANLDMVWEHHKFVDNQQDEATRERNLKILFNNLQNKPLAEMKPLYIYNLANALFAYEQWEIAAKLFWAFLEMNIWEEHRYIAHIRLADSLSNLGNKEGAIQERLRAIGVRPDYPDAYWGIGKDYYDLGEYKKAESFLKMCLEKPFPETILVCNPRDYDFNPTYLLSQVYIQLSDPRKSLEYLKKAQKFVKNKNDFKKLLKVVNGLVKELDIVEATIKKAQKLNDPVKIKKLLDSLPKSVLPHPGISFIRNKYFKKTESSGRDIVIYCGQSVEEWSPDSLKTGIGGSETAVIQLSRRLVKLGWNVTVYNSILEAKEFDGVLYRPFWEWNKDDKVDIFIGWRHAYVFTYSINATKKYLWLHDVPNTEEIDSVRVDNIDKIIVLSQYHRSLLPHIPDEKFFISSNGIDPEDFDRVIERKQNKCIYTSAPERGLKTLLELWPRVREQVKDAELYIYYGWDVYDKAYEGEKDKARWKQEVIDLMKQPGVMTDFPRIGQKELAKELLESNLFLYPCGFPEINCIAIQAAQAAGCLPITTDFAALKEMNQAGIQIHSDNPYEDKEFHDEFVKTIVEKLKNPTRYDSSVYLEKFSWQKTAEQWNKEFNESLSGISNLE